MLKHALTTNVSNSGLSGYYSERHRNLFRGWPGLGPAWRARAGGGMAAETSTYVVIALALLNAGLVLWGLVTVRAKTAGGARKNPPLGRGGGRGPQHPAP